ncbi:MAG: transposase, partial [Methyloprofundus sp.]|nr:transposase [Methyloprofundus sp.]
MNNQKHNRRSIRLKGYDYSQAGAYFVTICTQNRDCLFGEIIEGEMVLNDAGKMVQTIWDQIPPHYPGIGIDAFIAMPNHIHGIVIVGAATGGRPGSGNYDSVHGQHGHGQHGHGQPQGVAPTLSL